MFTVQNFCFNCIAPVVRPRKLDAPKKRGFDLRVVYECGSTISWKDYDKNRKDWTVVVHVICYPKSELMFENDETEL